jgi:NitT/TauT family transport system substrate-binding protein
MIMRTTRRSFLGATIASLATPHVARAQATTKLTFGSVGQAADIGIFAALKKGWFKAEGIELEMVNFASAANMVAPLGAGQLDVGGGSASAGLYNAWLRGIRLKIVADKASSQPGYAVNRIAVAKRHVDSGRYKEWKDLKGMKIAMNGTGISSWGTLAEGLKRGGLTFADITTVDMPFPDHVLALQNGAVDGSLTTEPSITIAIQRGYAVSLAGDDELVPRHAISQLLYPEDFATKKPDLALRFMRAYLRGVRLYNDALKDGKLAGVAADEVISILTESTPIKDPTVYRSIVPLGMDPDGKVDVPSLRSDYELYKSLGLVQGEVKVDEVVDMTFAAAAVKDLGPYRKP